MTDYVEVIIQCHDWSSDLASDLLIEMGSSGTFIQDIQDALTQPKQFGEVISQDLLARYPEEPLVHGYFPRETEGESTLPEQLTNTFQRAGFTLAESDYVIHPLEAVDWSENWKQYYHPIPLSHWLSIVPAWEAADVETNAGTIYLNPGMAFGTGSHPTTRLIINLMEIALHPGDTMIDVGTGSGILALVGAKLGAKSIDAYDYDGSVLETVQENIDLNPDITTPIHIEQKDKLAGVTKQVDLITANILADILLPLIPQAYQCLKDEGTLLLSGVFHDQFDVMITALKKADFYIMEYRRAGDWYAIEAKKGRKHRPKDSL